MHDKIVNLYFEWLYNFVCVGRYRRPISYRKLLMFLHDTEFISVLPMDKNRAEDGMSLRYQFLDNYIPIPNAYMWQDLPLKALPFSLVTMFYQCYLLLLSFSIFLKIHYRSFFTPLSI